MAAPTRAVTVDIFDAGGNPCPDGTIVDATLDVNEIHDGIVIAKKVSGTTTAGRAVLALFPNAPPPVGLGTRGSTWRVTAQVPGGRRLDVLARVPDENCFLHEIIVDDDAVPLAPADVAASTAQAAAVVATTKAGEVSEAHAVVVEKAEQVAADREVVAEVAQQFGDVAAAVGEAQGASSTAVTARNEAEIARADTLVARDHAVGWVNVRPSVEDGLNATDGSGASNRFFSVPSDESRETLILYRNDAGVATEIKRAPSATAVQEIVAIVGKTYNVGTDDLWVQEDGDGNVAVRLKDDGRFGVVELIVGDTEAAIPAALERDTSGRLNVKGLGLAIGGGAKFDEIDLTGTVWEEAAVLDVDDDGNVVRALMKDGTVRTATGAGSSAALLEQITLPNGVGGQNTNGGYTCTGLDRHPDRLWITGNDGRATEGSSTFNCSVVILHPDFRAVYRELRCHTVVSGIQSIQGVAWRTADPMILYVDKAGKKIRSTTFAGTGSGVTRDAADAGLTIDVASMTPNGIAYHPDEDAVWVHDEGSDDVYLISCEDGETIRSISGVATDLDQLHFDAGRNLLWATRGGNGSDGTLVAYDAATGGLKYSMALPGSQAVEGVYIDSLDRIFTLNDGAFHTAAKPPLALACIYELTLEQ